MNSKLPRALHDQSVLLGIYVAATLIVTIQRGVFGFPNDYAIFRAAFWNLVEGRDLYVLRLDQAHDYFKYSPSFALLFAPFALPPFVAGLFLWNLVNALSIFFALRLLLPAAQWAPAQILVALPTLRSVQSAQSNALVAALIIVAFVSYERGSLWRGAVAVGLGAIIKVFPLAALTFALPRRDRISALLQVGFVVAILTALPLFVIAPHALAAQYESWAALERTEAALVGASAMTLLRSAGFTAALWWVQLLAAATIVAVLVIRVRDWDQREVRLQFLGFVMVFCFVFNHRAERQSAVIAMCGMIVWYLACKPPRSHWRTALFAVVYLLVSLTGSEITPSAIKQALAPEVRLSIPLTVLWLVMLADLLVGRRNSSAVAEGG